MSFHPDYITEYSELKKKNVRDDHYALFCLTLALVAVLAMIASAHSQKMLGNLMNKFYSIIGALHTLVECRIALYKRRREAYRRRKK